MKFRMQLSINIPQWGFYIETPWKKIGTISLVLDSLWTYHIRFYREYFFNFIAISQVFRLLKLAICVL